MNRSPLPVGYESFEDISSGTLFAIEHDLTDRSYSLEALKQLWLANGRLYFGLLAYAHKLSEAGIPAEDAAVAGALYLTAAMEHQKKAHMLSEELFPSAPTNSHAPSTLPAEVATQLQFDVDETQVSQAAA